MTKASTSTLGVGTPSLTTITWPTAPVDHRRASPAVADQAQTGFAELAEEWLKMRISSGKRPLRARTANDYRKALDLVLLPRFGRKPVQAIDAEGIARLIHDLEREGLHAIDSSRARKPLLEATIRNYLKPLQGALRLAVRRRLIADSPFAHLTDDDRPAVRKRKQAHVWSDEELEALLAASERLALKPTSYYDYTPLLRLSGTRPSSLSTCLGSSSSSAASLAPTFWTCSLSDTRAGAPASLSGSCGRATSPSSCSFGTDGGRMGIPECDGDDWLGENHAMELGERLAQALARAAEIHSEQKRKGTEIPYLAHLLAVCALVLQDGGDETEAIAALLHDAAEDQGGAARLEALSSEFGAGVARIVAECSDTFEQPKPPWRARKERYLDHLPEASPSALRVSVSDKLDNARAILSDYRRLGDALWARFNPDADQLWYYRSLVTTYRAIDGFESTLLDELDRTVAELEALVGANRREGGPDTS